MADRELFLSKSEFGTPNHEIDSAPLLPAKAKLVRDFSRIIISLDNILIPEEKLSQTPSQLDGVPEDVEVDLKIFGSELIQTAGILLNLPQVAMATGQVLFQRFYYCKSLVKHSAEVVAMSCTHLASKIEEAPRRIRDVIAVFHHMKQIRNQKTISSLVLDQNYINLKNQVIKEERRVLKELGFCVHVKHPNKMIVMYLQVLEAEKNRRLLQCAWRIICEKIALCEAQVGHISEEEGCVHYHATSDEFVQKCSFFATKLAFLTLCAEYLTGRHGARNYMNDSFRTNVFVRFQPETIACACIYLAARQLQIPLPNNPAWYALFGVQESDIKAICLEILSLYTRAKPNPERLERTINDLKLRLKSNSKLHGIDIAPASAPGTPADKHRDSPAAPGGSVPLRDNRGTLIHSRSAVELERFRSGGAETSGDRKRRSDEAERQKNRLDVKSLEKATDRLKRSRSRSPSDVSRGRDVKRGRMSRDESYHSRKNRDAASHSRGSSPALKGSGRSSGLSRHDSGYLKTSGSGSDRPSADRMPSQSVEARRRHDKSSIAVDNDKTHLAGTKNDSKHGNRVTDSSGKLDSSRYQRHDGASELENRSDSYKTSKELSASNETRDRRHESSKEKRRHLNGSKRGIKLH